MVFKKAYGTETADVLAPVSETAAAEVCNLITAHGTFIAGNIYYLYDIGVVFVAAHGYFDPLTEYGALLANDILRRMDMPFTDRATIVSAIGHHDESTGGAVDIVSAAMIIADKTDVRRSRVRSRDKSTYDIHDWVNYAVTEANLKINREKSQIALELKIDEKICTMYEYFDIFLGRMQMCRHGAELFGAKFKLTANGSKVL